MTTLDGIDAVITWVDGNDPAHLSRLNAHLSSIPGKRPVAADPTRFNDAGELAYCISSLLRFAPWLRRIHIVTDRQRPSVLDLVAGTPWAERISIVDHREIFAGYEACLPTFNSRAIITALWRIPGLSERFLYLNDDFILLRPVSPQDFFDGDVMVLRGEWRLQSGHHPVRKMIEAWRRWRGYDPAKWRVRNLAAQERGAQLAGERRRYLRLFHIPFPMRRSTLSDFFTKHPEMLASNLSYKLRSESQFKTESLSVQLEWDAGRARLDNGLRAVQLKPTQQPLWRLRAHIRRANGDPRIAFACVQSLDLAPDELRRELTAWMAHRAGDLRQVAMNSPPVDALIRAS